MSDHEFSTRAERRTASRSGRRKAIGAVTALALVAGVGLGVRSCSQSDSPEASAPEGGRCAGSEIRVAVAPSLAAAVTNAVKGYKGASDSQGCARSYSVVSTPDGTMLDQIKQGASSTDLWISDSPRSYAAASEATKTHIAAGPAFAATPVVVSAPKAQIARLGSPAMTWDAAVSAQPALTVGDAATDTASALFMTRARADLGTGSASKQALGRWATTARAGIPTDAPHVTTEAALTQDAGAKRAGLAETALPGGSPLVPLGVASLTGDDPRTTAAADELGARLRGEGFSALAEAGYRDAKGAHAPTQAPDRSAALPLGSSPDDAAVASAVSAWENATKPLRMTAVFDVSGSMSAPVAPGAASRIQVVSETAQRALEVFPSSTQIALWEFSTGRDGTKDYKELVPMGPVSDEAHLQALRAGAVRLPQDVGGGTGLYDTIWAAYESAQKTYANGSVSSVTLLTDGRNDDATGGLDLAGLLAKIKGAKDAQRPVRVTTIAMGPDVDVPVLRQIADETGGKVYEAADARDVPRVLQESMFDRS